MCGSLPVVASLNRRAACGIAKHCDAAVSAPATCRAAELAPKWSRLPPAAVSPHLTAVPVFPADKRRAGGADIMVGLCGSRWPADCVVETGGAAKSTVRTKSLLKLPASSRRWRRD